MIEYVVIRDENRNQISIVDFFTDLIWSRRWYGCGDFLIKTPATDENVDFFKRGNFVSRNDDDEIGIIENISFTNNLTEGKMLTATGRFAKSILDRRLIYRLTGVQNQPTVIKGNVETAVRSLVKNNIITAVDTNRNIDFIMLGDVVGHPQIIVDENGKSASKQTSYANLLTYTDDVLYEYSLSSKMVLGADKKLYYNIFAGKDKSRGNKDGNQPIIFSYEFDNINNAVFSEDGTNEKTTALVGGSGQDLNRFYAMYNTEVSGMERKEVFIDASSISKEYTDDAGVQQVYQREEYTPLLLSYAKQNITPMAVIFAFNGEIDVNDNVYSYKKDFNIGDIVTFSDSGIELPVRVETVSEIQDSSGYRVAVELSA